MSSAVQESSIRAVDEDVLRRLFTTVAKIAAADARMRSGLTAGEFRFAYYQVRGQEMIPAGVGANLRREDYLVTTYRCLHDVIGKEVPLREVIAEMLGRSTGTSGGKGGPMHLADPKSGLMLTTGIVGGGVPIANGLALAAKMRGTDQITVCNFGDGSTSIGAVHEGLNLAAVWELPAIFVCQNNRYAEHTPQARYTKSGSLASRAESYGMAAETVDGNDPIAVYEAVRTASERARSGGGPTFIEAKTYRLMGHGFGADTSYMDPDLLQQAWDKDPVPAFRSRLLGSGLFTEAELTAIETAVSAEIEDAIEFAKQSPLPEASQLLTDVFASVEEVPQ